MKKPLLLALALAMLISFAACRTGNNGDNDDPTAGGNDTTEPAGNAGDTDTSADETTEADETTADETEKDLSDVTIESSLEDILAKIYATANTDDYFKEYSKEGLVVTPITEKNIEYHLGTSDIEYEEAIASEPMMSTSAYALCLVRVREGADIEQIKTAIKENADPRKWVCVGVDPDNVYVDSIGDVVILIMSDDQGAALHEAFLNLNAK